MWFYVLWCEQIVDDGFRWILDGTVYFKVYLEFLKSLHRHILCVFYVCFPQQQQQQEQQVVEVI